MKKSIHQSYFFSQSPENVWEYLTNPDLMQLWLMKNDFKPIEGYDFQFSTNAIPTLNFDGIFHCKVLEIIPYKKLSYSWKGGPGDGSIILDTIVVWTLHEKQEGTELILVHSGFDEIENLDFYNGMSDGWLKKLHKISEQINNSKHVATQL